MRRARIRTARLRRDFPARRAPRAWGRCGGPPHPRPHRRGRRRPRGGCRETGKLRRPPSCGCAFPLWFCPPPRRGAGGRREIHLHVDTGRKFVVGLADEFAAADVLDGGDLALHGGDLFLHAVDELIDGVLLAPVIEDEGGFVVTLGLFHGGRGG